MVKYKQKSRRERARSRSKTGGLAGGAGLMKFFEDSGMGVKVSPVSVITLAIMLIGIVIIAHVGIFDWIF